MQSLLPCSTVSASMSQQNIFLSLINSKQNFLQNFTHVHNPACVPMQNIWEKLNDKCKLTWTVKNKSRLWCSKNVTLLQNVLKDIFTLSEHYAKLIFFSYNKNEEYICHCISTLVLEQSSKINKIVIVRPMALGSLCWGWKDAQVAFSSEQKWMLLFLCFLPWVLWFMTEAVFHPVYLG